MATLAAQKVKLYKATYDFLKLYNSRDSTLKTSLLNVIRKGGKRDYSGIPLIGYAWIIFKNSPHFTTSHGFNLLDALKNQQFDKFADILDDLFTSFWESMRDRESFEQEIQKIDSNETEHPQFISKEEHQELSRIESLPEGPLKQQEFTNFAHPRIAQLHTPSIPSTEQPPTVVPKTPPAPLNPTEEVKTPPVQKRPSLKSFKLPKMPEGITTPVKTFLHRNLTIGKIIPVFTGGLGAIVGYGATGTSLGAVGGGGLGAFLPSLIKDRGFGSLVLGGVTKAGNTGATVLSGLSRGGGGRMGGGFFRSAAGGAGKKWAIAALLIFLILAAFMVGFAPPGTPGTPGGNTPPAAGSGTLTPIPGGSNSLGYNIPFRDTTIRVKTPDDIKNQIRTFWPNAQLQNWDTIVSQSILNGWNPAFVLTLWIEESGAQGAVRYDDALGCEPTNPTTDINISLGCLFRSFPITKYSNDKFEDFMCMYSESRLAPCQFITNPNFPRNIRNWYSRLVPDGPGTITTPTPTPIPTLTSGGSIISCPLSRDGSGSFVITCGTALNPASNGCGHGVPPIYPKCQLGVYESCPNGDFTPQLKSAIDVRPAQGNGNNSVVYLPYVSGKSVNWTRVLGPIPLHGFRGEYWGERIEYTAIAADSRQIRIDLTHIDKSSINNRAGKSGDQVGVTLNNLDAPGSHLHTGISINGKWLDSISEAHLCSP